MQNYTFRDANIADLQELKSLGQNSFGQYKNHLTEENWQKLNVYLTGESTYHELLGKSRCFVCIHENAIVGMAFFLSSGNPTEVFQEDWSYMRMVGVNKAYGGKGIGKYLIKQCLAYAKETGEKAVALHTSEFMDAARHIYESMGFCRIRQLPDRLGKRYWLYLLEL
jgi:ribosomal protein S18 acetylase RimI-like enzyme